MARPVFGVREGPNRPRPGSPISIVTDRSSRRPVGIRPNSKPCIGSTWPRCTASPSTSSANHHAAEDATERTFLSALADLPKFDERARPEDGDGASTFKVWLFQIARNGISNERRTARRNPVTVLQEPVAAMIADPLNVEEDAVLRDEASVAWSAVGRLPTDRRRALVLRFVNELSTAEIAGVLGRSEGAVRVLLHRGLRAVARDLGDRAGKAPDSPPRT